MRLRIISIVLFLLAVGIPFAQQPSDPLYALPDAFADPVTSSASMVVTNRGRLIVANQLTDSIGVVDVLNRRLDVEVFVGDDPRHVALTPDNGLILVTNRLSGTLSVIETTEFQVVAEYPVGILPYGVVASPDGQSAYIARLGNNDVVRVALNSGAIEEIIPTPDAPIGLALWGEFLYVTHLWTGQISLIYRPTARLAQTIRLHPQASHTHTVTIDARNGLAYVPYTISNTRAQFPDQLALPRIGVVDLAQLAVINTATIDLITADRWLNLPHAMTFDITNNQLFIVSSGSNALTILQRDQSLASAHFDTDAMPRTVIAGRDGVSVYVHNTGAQTIGIYETRFNSQSDTIPTSTIAPDSRISLAQRAFNTQTAPLTPTCATCHFDGLSDGRVWGQSPDHRNTPLLLGLNENALGWQRVWQTLADVSAHPLLSGTTSTSELGAMPADAIDNAALVAYLQSLTIPPSPNTLAADGLTRGVVLYERLECSLCHDNPSSPLMDVETGGEFIAPALRGLWLSAPYFHDGRAETLRDVFTRGDNLHHLHPEQATDAEVDALVQYLLTRN